MEKNLFGHDKNMYKKYFNFHHLAAKHEDRDGTECEGMINVICIQTILKLHKTLGDTFIGHSASILALSWKTNPLIGFQM